MMNSELNKKELTRKVISVADAVAMNTAPEYWLSIKLACLHLLALVSVAKLFVAQLLLNQLTHH